MTAVSRRVAVLGQGPLGVSVAMRAVLVGHDVVGFDLDRRTVAALADGRSPIDELGDRELGAALDSQRYRPTDLRAELVGFDVAVITASVSSLDGGPHCLNAQVASDLVGRNLRSGCVVISESSGSSPTPEDELVAILESTSGLRVGADVHLGRVLDSTAPPTAMDRDFTRLPEVSGFDAASTSVVVDFYRGLASQSAMGRAVAARRSPVQ